MLQFENPLLQSHGYGAAERHLGEAHGTENAVLNDLCRGARTKQNLLQSFSPGPKPIRGRERERDALLENNIDEFFAAPKPSVKKVFLNGCGETQS